MKTRPFYVAASALIASVSLAIGCSSSTTSPGPAGSDSGVASDSAVVSDAGNDTSSAVDAKPDVPTSQFKECTDAELAAQPVATNGADISFMGAGVDGGALVYTNNCVRIPVGKDVGWYGDFAMHPLANNGEPGTPVPNKSSGNDSGRITFPTAGKFSFRCTAHPTTMFGTVLVQ